MDVDATGRDDAERLMVTVKCAASTVIQKSRWMIQQQELGGQFQTLLPPDQVT